MAEITIKDLLESGAHFGHQTRRWNPKMKRFIFEARNGLYIIDLAKTLQQVRSALKIVRDVVTNNQTVLFVGTKKQAKGVLRELTEQCGEFYVCERWLGGMLTNLSTIRQSVKKLDRIEKRIATGGDGLTKKELSLLTKDQLKLERNLSGVRAMRKLPSLLVVVDPHREHIAVAEANKLGIPVMALVDTNCDPDPIHHVIACNDDALKSIKLILSAIAQTIVEVKNELRIAKGKEAAAKEAVEAKEDEEKATVAAEKSASGKEEAS